MPQYEKDGKVITATQKAYDVLYKARGFVPYVEQETGEDEGNKQLQNQQQEQQPPDDNQNGERSELFDLTVDELKSMAKDMGVKGYTKMNEAELVAAIEAVDAQ